MQLTGRFTHPCRFRPPTRPGPTECGQSGEERASCRSLFSDGHRRALREVCVPVDGPGPDVRRREGAVHQQRVAGPQWRPLCALRLLATDRRWGLGSGGFESLGERRPAGPGSITRNPNRRSQAT